ncbi:MAG TPA: hypothetical protein PLU43_12200 [Lachnospiraceae bacterium]|nr:hypothetical protein [Lachnospiraceae bacterium]
MDGFRERFSGRFDRSTERGGSDRNNQDRYERTARKAPSSGYGASERLGLEEITEAIDKSNTKQLEIIGDFFDEAKDDRLTSEKDILQALDENAGLVDKNTSLLQQNAELIRQNADVLNDIRIKALDRAQAPAPVPAPPVQIPSVDGAAKEEIMQALLSNTSLLNMMRQEIAVYRTEPEPEKPAEDESQAVITAIDNYFKNMEDHVHKENVKCYRNVQAAVTEQNVQTVDETKKNLGALKVFAIVSMVLSVVNIGLLAAYIFGVI